jgi:hypothetical protein
VSMPASTEVLIIGAGPSGLFAAMELRRRGVQARVIERVLIELNQADGTTETVEANWVIGAGGAHSVTRESMAETLEGTTYPGTSLVASGIVTCSLPRDGSALIAGPEGWVLLVPLPGGHWLTFVGDLDAGEARRLTSDPATGAVGAMIERRVAQGIRMEEVAWAAPFRMHRRMVPQLADGRCFLLGDAGHLSSPFGGEGLNSGIHDGCNLAWKLALELGGRGRPRLLESFAPERLSADRHVLMVSDRLHHLATRAVESARTGTVPAPPTPAEVAAMVQSRSMLDVSYAGSSIVGEYPADTRTPMTPAPGDRYPDRAALTGPGHHLVLFGVAEDAGITALRRRWRGLVDVRHVTGDPRRAGLATEGAVLVRPDGHIGFLAPPNSAGLDALDNHLDSYLIPANA